MGRRASVRAAASAAFTLRISAHMDRLIDVGSEPFIAGHDDWAAHEGLEMVSRAVQAMRSLNPPATQVQLE